MLSMDGEILKQELCQVTDGNWETYILFYLFQKNWLDSGAPSQQAMRMWLFTSGQNISLSRQKGVGVWALGLQCGQRTNC